MSSQSLAATGSSDLQALEQALAALQATASQFSASCINDAQARVLYSRDIATMSSEFRAAVSSGQMSPREAAEQASAMRNHIMEMSRRGSSPVVRAYVTRMKKLGRSFSQLQETYAQREFKVPFSALSQDKQSTVYLEIMRASGRPDPKVMLSAEKIGRVGRRVLLVSLAIAVYEVAEAENKPREVARQGALATAGIAGGWAAGSAVVAAGVCAATAPLCVSVAAFVGGLLAAYGADAGLGSLYPRPNR